MSMNNKAFLLERSYELEGDEVVNVKITSPSETSNGDWQCDFYITGLSNPKSGSVVGIDQIQSLWLTLCRVGSELVNSSEASHGSLKWLGEPVSKNLGFPTIPGLSLNKGDT